jgi:hypothetical protein
MSNLEYKNKFIIKYKVENFEGENECLPLEILPDRLSMNDVRISVLNFDSTTLDSTSIA